LVRIQPANSKSNVTSGGGSACIRGDRRNTHIGIEAGVAGSHEVAYFQFHSRRTVTHCDTCASRADIGGYFKGFAELVAVDHFRPSVSGSVSSAHEFGKWVCHGPRHLTIDMLLEHADRVGHLAVDLVLVVYFYKG
jgi:hypothetical protein